MSNSQSAEKLADAEGTGQSGLKKKPPKYISETDPEAAWSLRDGRGRFSFETNYLVDTDHGIIVDVEATPARLSQEIVAAKKMLDLTAAATLGLVKIFHPPRLLPRAERFVGD